MTDDRSPLGPVLLQQFNGDKEAAYRYLDDLREANEAVRKRTEAKRQEEAAEREAKQQAARDAHAAEHIAALKASLRASFRGSDSDFLRLWPTMRDEALAREAIEQREALLEAKRRQLGL